MRLHTAKQRRKRKLFGPQLSKPDIRRLALLNRYAACKDREIGARERIYNLKDFILRRYGKPAGYTLQHWTSPAWEDTWDEESVIPDGCDHEHILERIKLANLIFHRPTGHFSFYNCVTNHCKESGGFEQFKKKCVDRFEGKKVIASNSTPKHVLEDAYRRLFKRLRHQINKEAGK
ncbi:MAG TPA: hypothetical protein PKA34_29080 [Blastocatellia bacterium]|nr:hypothetical protein [Blastocatellia bacterium]